MTVGVGLLCGHAELKLAFRMCHPLPGDLVVLFAHRLFRKDKATSVMQGANGFCSVLRDSAIDLVQGQNEILFPKQHACEMLQHEDVIRVTPRRGLEDGR